MIGTQVRAALNETGTDTDDQVELPPRHRRRLPPPEPPIAETSEINRPRSAGPPPRKSRLSRSFGKAAATSANQTKISEYFETKPKSAEKSTPAVPTIKEPGTVEVKERGQEEEEDKGSGTRMRRREPETKDEGELRKDGEGPRKDGEVAKKDGDEQRKEGEGSAAKPAMRSRARSSRRSEVERSVLKWSRVEIGNKGQ